MGKRAGWAMRIAVLSDIHGNVPALEVVLQHIERWGADQVVVNGDLVSRGPYSLQCLRLLQERLPGCRLLKGNHEAFVLASADHGADGDDPADPTFDLRRLGYWVCRQLGPAVEEIRGWDDHVDLGGPGDRASLHITHGSRRGNRDGIHPATRDDELMDKLGEPRDLFVCSHTHKPLVRRFDGTVIVNTGSVGQPFDGDPRAAYGQLTLKRGDWQADIVRVSYDKARAERDFVASGFVDECGPLARLIRLEHQQSCAHVAPWRRRYLEAVEAGRITVAAAVDEYLKGV